MKCNISENPYRSEENTCIYITFAPYILSMTQIIAGHSQYTYRYLTEIHSLDIRKVHMEMYRKHSLLLASQANVAIQQGKNQFSD